MLNSFSDWTNKHQHYSVLNTVQASSRNIRSNLTVKDNIGGLTDDAKHEIAKTLTEKQTLECVMLESQLKEEEIKQINHGLQVRKKWRSWLGVVVGSG